MPSIKIWSQTLILCRIDTIDSKSKSVVQTRQLLLSNSATDPCSNRTWTPRSIICSFLFEHWPKICLQTGDVINAMTDNMFTSYLKTNPSKPSNITWTPGAIYGSRPMRKFTNREWTPWLIFCLRLIGKPTNENVSNSIWTAGAIYGARPLWKLDQWTIFQRGNERQDRHTACSPLSFLKIDQRAIFDKMLDHTQFMGPLPYTCAQAGWL